MSYRVNEYGVRMPPETYIIMLEDKYEKWSMQFNLMQLLVVATPIKDVKRILIYILKNKYAWNDDYIPLIDEWVDYLVYEAKENHKFANKNYVDNFKLTDQGHMVNGLTVMYTKKEIKEIEKSNRFYTSELKTAKRNVERYEKRKILWNELKETYSKYL